MVPVSTSFHLCDTKQHNKIEDVIGICLAFIDKDFPWNWEP